MKQIGERYVRDAEVLDRAQYMKITLLAVRTAAITKGQIPGRRKPR
ncbi:MAG: hypothetical protein ACYS74_17330 [Planctomycetota bacterium]